MYAREILARIEQRLLEPRHFIQVLAGPRQTGKTTLANQVLKALPFPSHYATADEPSLKGPGWIEAQWEVARRAAHDAPPERGALLVLDEVQKAPLWSETMKRLWDEDTRTGLPLRVLLLGSSPLLIQTGLTESLAGRFEVIPINHWSFREMREAFGWNLEQYLFYGGYPGAAPLISEPERWGRYISDSLIETTIARDVLLMTRVDKPALLRQLFHLACDYSGQILSYTKMLGQLTDAGNTTTLAHYLRLLDAAGMIVGLSKFSGKAVRRRASSPKLLVRNTALMNTAYVGGLSAAIQDPAYWGRIVESAVGAHLANSAAGSGIELLYWREGSYEVDFVLRRGHSVTAIEVKSSRKKESLSGLEMFSARYHPTRVLMVGAGGVSVPTFLERPAEEYL